ncbi:unnamed protein product [Sphagnum balticum]
MATEFGRKLACDLIFSQFGESVQKVCKSLVYHGQLSLPEIARYTEMSMTQIYNSLLVLVQHSCVQAFKVEHGAPPRELTLYIALTDNILHRMHFPKFLVLVKGDVDDQAEALVEGLLEHGRLTLEQLIQRAAASEGEVATVVKDCFQRLLANHYIEQCPVPEPSLCPNIAVEPAKKMAHGAEVTISEEQRIMSAAAPTDAERFQAPVSLISMGGTHTEMGDPNPVGQKVSEASYRKREALQIDAKTAAAVAMDEKEVLWRVNYEEFVRRLRHQLGQGMTVERLQVGLQQLVSDSAGYVSRIGEQGGLAEGSQYVVRIHILSVLLITKLNSFIASLSPDLHKIIELLQQNEVEGIVLQRYGQECCRIFRLLGLNGQLEQKQIGERAMVPKDVRELLYRLLKDHYVQVQEVAKTAERVASKSIHLWCVDNQAVLHQVLDDIYLAASNLSQQLAHELEKEQQQEQVKPIQSIMTVLEASLLKLDNAMLLFHDF